MAENSTPSRIEPKDSVCKDMPTARPSKRTIEFIRQFARCYQVSQELPAAVNAMVIN